MAEEGVSIAVGGSPSDHEKKRKLEDLEANAPEPLNPADSDSKSEPENQEKVGEADESELKRPRFESNEDNNGKLDGPATENGYQEKDNIDKSDQPEEQKFEEQSVGKESSVLEGSDGQEKAQVDVASADEERLATGDKQSGENEEPSGEHEKLKNEIDEEVSKEEFQEPSANVTQDASDSQTISRKIEVPNNKVGVLIGKAGDTIRYLQYNSGAKIQIMRDADADPRSATRPVELIGTLESIIKAEKLINDVIAEADAGGSPSLVARGFSTVQAVVGDQIEIQVPNEKVGLIIGKGGETIKNLQTRSGARIQLVPQHLPAGDQSKERTVRVTGDKKQIEVARDLIKEVMNQNVRPSPLSGGYSQQAFRPRGPVAPQWGSRGPHPSQFMGYDYQQRGPYPPQNPQYPPSSYGNYPPPQAQRSSFGPSWEQRPPSAMHGPPQGNYNYGQPHNQEYGQPTGYHQPPMQSYGQGYNEMKYENQGPVQHPYGGHAISQQTGYPLAGGTHPGYGAPDQYGRPTSYGIHPQAPHGQSYGQPRPPQPGEMSYQAPATQAYGSNVPTQQSYPYASSGTVQQSYPPYGSAPPTDGYSHPQPASGSAPGYPQQGGPAVSGYGQTGVQQQPSTYTTGALTTGYGSYPAQPGYADQPAVATAGYGYQASADASYAAAGAAATTYGGVAPTAPQSGYVQPAPAQTGYEQSNTQSAGYGATAPTQVPAPTAYGKSSSPQPGGYPQYDSSQMYGAPR